MATAKEELKRAFTNYPATSRSMIRKHMKDLKIKHIEFEIEFEIF